MKAPAAKAQPQRQPNLMDLAQQPYIDLAAAHMAKLGKLPVNDQTQMSLEAVLAAQKPDK